MKRVQINNANKIPNIRTPFSRLVNIYKYVLSLSWRRKLKQIIIKQVRSCLFSYYFSFSVKRLSQVFFRKQQTQSGSDLNLFGNGFTLRIQEPRTSTKTYLDIKSAHWGSPSATNKHRNFGRPVKTGVREHSNEQSWSRSTFFMLICFGQRISTTSLLTPRSEREIGARAVGSVANETLLVTAGAG